jgi:hypothetical protein
VNSRSFYFIYIFFFFFFWTSFVDFIFFMCVLPSLYSFLFYVHNKMKVSFFFFFFNWLLDFIFIFYKSMGCTPIEVCSFTLIYSSSSNFFSLLLTLATSSTCIFSYIFFIFHFMLLENCCRFQNQPRLC